MSIGVEAVDVSVRHGNATRLTSVSISLEPGRVHAIIGANGSGKSTLLTVLAGELNPSGGTVHLKINDTTRSWRDIRVTEAARLRALLAQETPTAFAYTVTDVISWGRLPWRGTANAADDESVLAEEIKANDIAHLLDRHITELSGGERARVHLARVLAQRAALLLLDEADAALDLAGQAHLDAAVERRRDAGDTIVVISHDLTRVAAIADTVTVLKDGHLLTHGKVAATMTTDILSEAYSIPIEVRMIDDTLLIRRP